MPNRLMLEIGANTYSVPLGGSVTQIRQALARYATFHRIPTEGRTNEEIVVDILNQIKDTVRQTSISVQRQLEVESRLAAVETTVQTDNNL